MRRLLVLCGILAPLVYIATWVVGGLITPGYSHLAQAVSELTQAGSSNAPLLNPWFMLYNILIALFGFGLFTAAGRNGGRRGVATGGILVATSGLVGVPLTLFCPMDPIGSEATLPGMMHLVLVGIISLLTVAGILASATALPRSWRRYCLVTAAVMFATGIMSGITAAQLSPVAGLVERVTITSFQQWMFVMAWALAVRQPAKEAVLS